MVFLYSGRQMIFHSQRSKRWTTQFGTLFGLVTKINQKINTSTTITFPVGEIFLLC